MHKKILIACIAILIVASVLHWSSVRDKKLMDRSKVYEQCVIAKYGMAPMEWYWSHDNTMPNCEVK